MQSRKADALPVHGLLWIMLLTGAARAPSPLTRSQRMSVLLPVRIFRRSSRAGASCGLLTAAACTMLAACAGIRGTV